MKEKRSVFIEAEAFAELGGWVIDSQFEEEMGSAYLLAHGMGKPVADAVTTANIPCAGKYRVWARVKDWVPEYHPGRFELKIGSSFTAELGNSGKAGWRWESAGETELAQGDVRISLHDLTGFEGRCDAIYLSLDDDVPPETGSAAHRAWRKSMLGLPDEPVDAGEFDVVVVGGGVAGCSAALVAAKTGSKVALISDRPVLGGNASTEIGLGPRGYKGKFVSELCRREDNGDLAAVAMLREEPNVTVFLNEKVYAVGMDGDAIKFADMRNARSSAESRVSAKMFIDCSGKGALARPAGAEIRTGREGRAEFGESFAPDAPDDKHHGHTVLYHLHEAKQPVEFPEVPWATAVARDFGSLDGQMMGLGMDNHFGPDVRGRHKLAKELKKAANVPSLGIGALREHCFPQYKIMDFFPGTHYWEYGQTLDLFTSGEEIRDHLLRALYGTMYNVKRAQPEKCAKLEFEWLRYVPASGEYCRIIGDHIVNENEIRSHTVFSDAVVQQDGAICVHCMDEPEYDFRLTSWIWDVRDMKPYWLPLRSLYSKNVSNLMMAGKQISVSRVVGCNTKLMANGAEHGVAVGCTASLCCRMGLTPHEICQKHMGKLRGMVDRFEWQDGKEHANVMQFFG